MVKRIAKYGFKSGLLPKSRLRNIAKEFARAETDKTATQGYADPLFVPRGSAAEPIQKTTKTADEIINDSAKVSQKQLSHISPEQKLKSEKATIRRTYLSDSLRLQELNDKEEWKKLDEMAKKEKVWRAGLLKTEDSEATKLTLPTINSFLNKPLVEPYTEEQRAILKAKRESNRIALETKFAEQRARQYLDLYQRASKFIVTEEQLEEAIERAVMNGTSDSSKSTSFYNVDILKSERNNDQVKNFSNAQLVKMHGGMLTDGLVPKLTQELVGSTDVGRPGLAEIRDVLNGNADEYTKKVNDFKLKKIEEDKAAAKSVLDDVVSNKS
ncbi:hypothetical protein NADFUDRAFT_44688 [Nadsonia fulvescens var. elongata DSM 6958]|uniref:Uncharacterized protein n=1 Tax=Nadsonia fulvescens var. elongata DSM 6958 TaxID=857566 RepID=A0A1E3PRE3_9ASCO|nr:hypothetical protein NADFUDRAFT_44688 [Nadsonia fulvescens var. elongata DSM 6958]